MRHERRLSICRQGQLGNIAGPHEARQILSKGFINLGKDIACGLKGLRKRLAHSDFLAPLTRKDQREFFHVWFLQIAPVVKGDRECKQALEKQAQMRFTPAFTRRHAALVSLE